MQKVQNDTIPTDSRLLPYPTLTAIQSQWMTNLFSNYPFLDKLLQKYGSPINIIQTEPFEDNFQSLTQVFNNHGLKHSLYFARKANRCKVFVQESTRLGMGVDTASYLELKQCLELGCPPQKLVVTAAIKSESLIHLALGNSIPLILDNEDECLLVNRIAGEVGKTADIGIRISGFHYGGQKLYSRFGFDIEESVEFIFLRLGKGKKYQNLRFNGFHFHLNGYSVEQRGEALFQTIHITDQLLNLGIATSFIDMGGGILMNYLSSPTEWHEFWMEHKRAVMGDRPPLTFGNNGLGYQLIDGKLHGEPDVYPYYNGLSKGDFLEAVVSYKNPDNETPASLLRERGIEIRIEPGRSMLDQTGITLAEVVYRKKDSQGEWLIGLGMNRSQLGSSSADFLLDPIFIPGDTNTREMVPTGVFFTGGYCLEQDIILKRKIILPCLPEVGDIICFPNTSGYLMHFYATRSHLFEFATNLVLDHQSGTVHEDGL